MSLIKSLMPIYLLYLSPILLCRGQALEALGRWDEALLVYSKYIKKYPNDSFFKSAHERAQRKGS